MRRSASRGALVATLCAPGLVMAQANVHGTVRDSAQGVPLPLVEVVVDGMNLRTLTDAQGRYALNIPLGFHTILFRRIGYHGLARQLRLSTKDSVRLDIAMLDQAQRLDPVQVEAPAPPRTWPPGMDARIKEGFGQFVTDSVLRRFEHSTISNLLQSQTSSVRFKRVSGRNVAFSGRGPRGGRPGGRASGPLDCYYSIWLDGVLMYEPGEHAPGPQLDGTRVALPPDLDRFAVVGLEAIEVYTPAQIPGQYRGGSSGCGVILLWSRTQRN